MSTLNLKQTGSLFGLGLPGCFFRFGLLSRDSLVLQSPGLLLGRDPSTLELEQASGLFGLGLIPRDALFLQALALFLETPTVFLFGLASKLFEPLLRLSLNRFFLFAS